MSARASRAFHLMAKPAGAACNLRCDYCFYLDKQSLFAPRTPRRMGDETLEAFVRQYIEAQPGNEVVFAWQGGEPTLLGLDFYRRAMKLQRRHAGGRRIANTLQTNGTLLDDDWGTFLKQHDFLVGISVDGPPSLHDALRRDARSRGSSERVLRGLRVLQRHRVEFNTLTCVSAANCAHPVEVYRYLKEIGSRHLQFIPIVEQAHGRPTPESITGQQWGSFMCGVFDEWARADAGALYVDLFELSLMKWCGLPGGSCVHAETCGDALAIEHDGSVYACDHFVDAAHRLGNLHTQPLATLVDDPRQLGFGLAKSHDLPDECYGCPVLFACHGGCPKHREVGPDGARRNRLCAGYRAFFTHVDPWMRERVARLRSRPAARNGHLPG